MKHLDLLKLKRGELKTERDSIVVAAGSREKLGSWEKVRVAEIEELLKQFAAKESIRIKKIKKKNSPKEKREPYNPDISRFLEK